MDKKSIKKAEQSVNYALLGELSLFYSLYKVEHFIGAIVRVVFFVVRHWVRRLKMLAPKFVDLETAFVDVEMDIPLFKIGRTGFPHDRFGMEGFHRLPRAVADAFGMLFGSNEQNLQFVMVGFVINF